MRKRIHIFGASGSGTSSLGQALAARHGLAYFEADDFFWMPTEPPYQQVRQRLDRQQLLTEALSGGSGWVLSGSITGWGDGVIELFDLAVFIVTPTVIRLERLRAREFDRFGARIQEAGDMHSQHTSFIAWAAEYDEGTTDVRSRRLHEEWLSGLPCTVVRVDGSRSIDTLADQLSAVIVTSDSR